MEILLGCYKATEGDLIYHVAISHELYKARWCSARIDALHKVRHIAHCLVVEEAGRVAFRGTFGRGEIVVRQQVVAVALLAVGSVPLPVCDRTVAGGDEGGATQVVSVEIMLTGHITHCATFLLLAPRQVANM
ncbi:MAG TPA: hypothetical protein P5121_31415 [Caldilineaceae bacterium]|nr:hypothetical protein [Caldilineaceae bacterium]